MKVFWNYREEDSTWFLNNYLAAVLPAGVYQGFDANLSSDMILRLHQNNAVETIEQNGQVKRYGVIRTKQGVTVLEDNQVSFSIAPTTTLPRIDVVFFQHQYEATEISPIGFYGVLQGTMNSNPAAPSLNVPAFQTKIGELHLPANCTSLLQAKFIKEKTPILQRRQKTLIIARKDMISTSSYEVVNNYIKQMDSLNELNILNGEFTAQKTGLYFISAVAKLDFADNSNKVGLFILQANNGTGWIELESSVQNNPNSFAQIKTGISIVVPMLNGDKVRLIVQNLGDGYINAQQISLYIYELE
ncbi:MAG: hypothetical protein OHK0045_21980 [Raineya sp.]